jgi:hypothetical protein
MNISCNLMCRPKFIAFYFPQFHAIPENDIWWGKGFNDWDLVKKTRPLFRGHKQPRVPLDGIYYNPCQKETLIKQAQLAKSYGIDGFMMYHYWYDGKLLLEKPLETFLKNRDINIEFCICWANETWTRAWIGKPEEILIEQKHSEDEKLWTAHFNYLLPFFKDPRAIKKDGKPVFVVYQPHLIKNTKAMFRLWNELARQNGLEGLYYIANKNHSYTGNISFLECYDALLKFQPREAHNSKFFKERTIVDRMQFLRILPSSVFRYLQKFKYKLYDYKIIDSDKIWQIILSHAYKNEFSQYQLDIYESGYFEWDNTPRYNDKARIFTDPGRESKLKYLRELTNKAIENHAAFVFWNAWNEWSEGAHLEPDTSSEYENLEIVKEIFGTEN